MMRKTSGSGRSRVLGRVTGVVLTLAVPWLQAADEEKGVEEILVTGSYIKRDNFNSPSPVSVIDSLDIESAGTTNMADIIFQQPQNIGTEVLANPGQGASGPSASSARTGGSSQGGIGLANLRGLGERATMDLMDGHRLVFGDANFVYPQIAIQRIEILLDGASALYGSEAIAGAVNYIPLKSFDGFKVQIERHDQFEESAPDDKIGILAGIDSDRGNFLFALESRNRDRLEQSAYPKYLRQGYPTNSNANNGFPGAAYLPRRNATGAITSSAIVATNQRPDPGCGFDYMNPGSDPVVPFHDRWGVLNSTGRLCGTNFSNTLDWNAELEQLHGYTRFDYEFTDNITFSGDAMFGRQEFDTRATPSPVVASDLLQVPGDLAGNPFRAFTDTNFNGKIDAGEQLLYAADNCNFTNCSGGDGFADRDINGDGIADPLAQGRWGIPVLLPSATNDSDGDGIPDRFDPDNGIGFNEDVTLTNWSPFGKNLTGYPGAVGADGTIPRNRKIDNLRLSGGVNIEIPDTSWSVDLTGIWAKREQTYALAFGSVANFSTPQLQAAFNCVNPADVAAGRCMQFNPFSTSQFQIVNRVPQATPTDPDSPEFNTRDEADAIFTFNDDFVESIQKIVDVVAAGDLFELPAGDVGMAVGYSFRRTELDVDVNQLNATSTNTFGTAVQPQDAYIESNDVFVEFSVPVLDYDWSGTLELQLAARYTDNEADSKQGLATSAEFDDTVLKAALLWQPTDWVSLRASYGEGFVVPELGDLFQGTREATRNAGDPTCTVILPIEIPAPADPSLAPVCNYATSAGTRINASNSQSELIQGNPDLEPESSDSYNIGVTFSLLDGDLTLQADYFTVDYEDVIFQLRAATTQDQETARFAEYYVNECGPEPPTAGDATPAQIACAIQARNDWILTDGLETDRYTRDIDDVSGQPIGLINTIRADFVNLLAQEVTAIDLMAAYAFESSEIPLIGGEYGSFEIRVQGTYMDEYTYQTLPTAPVIQGEGNRNDAGGGSQIPPIPQWRVLGSLSWNYDQHYARLTGRYHDSVKDRNADGSIRPENLDGQIDSSIYWDLFYAYTFDELIGSGTTQVSLGIQNLFDYEPQAIEDSSGIDTNLDNPLGTMWTLRLSHEF